jgi:glycosyltransferase involved in cell wall biosynthesis
VKGVRLLLVTDAVGGVWIYSLELARALRSLGIETLLAITGPSPRADQREAAAAIPLIDTGLPLEWLDDDPSAVERAGEALARIASQHAIDIVQTSSAALLAGADLNRPSVAVQHSCVATWWAAVKGTALPEDFSWRRELVHRGLENADAIVAPTRAFADATERTYGLDGRVTAVYNGRTPRATRSLPPGRFVLTAGRLWDEGKNAKILDCAAAHVDAPFQAAGAMHGPNGAAVAFEHLVPLGELSEAHLGRVLAARPVFASAALYEPFGLAALEAADAGCALVLSDIDTHRELWEGAAVFVDPRHDKGFATAISRLLADPAERARLGRDARARAREYTSQPMADAMADIYAHVLDAQPQLIAGAA